MGQPPVYRSYTGISLASRFLAEVSKDAGTEMSPRRLEIGLIMSHIKAQDKNRTRSNTTLSDKIYRGLKKEIITTKYPPGAMIFESDLVKSYGVSKTPIREALKRLTQEGLVASIPGIGYSVSAITLKDVRELYQVRRIVEIASVEMTVEVATDEQIEQLTAFVGKSYALDDEKNWTRFLQSNLEFHTRIVAMTRNDRLVRIFQGIMEDMSRILVVDYAHRASTESLVRGHVDIVRALQSRDARRATEIVTREIDRSLRMVQDSLTTKLER